MNGVVMLRILWGVLLVALVSCSENTPLLTSTIADNDTTCAELGVNDSDSECEEIEKSSVDKVTGSSVNLSESNDSFRDVSSNSSDVKKGTDVSSSVMADDEPDISPAPDEESSNDAVIESSEDEAGKTSRYTDPAIDLTDTGKLNWLYRRGAALYDSKGTKVRLTGVNWFGFETAQKVMHGLWTADYKKMLQQMVDLGFNSVRIPWANVILDEATPVEVNSYGEGGAVMNAELVGATPVEALVAIVNEAQRIGLKIILDNHSRKNDGYMEEDLWYTDQVSEEQWIEDWKYVAELFKNNDAVIGMDLNNEPHDRAAWGGGDPLTDWAMASEKCGNAILEINPNVLIMIEGVEGYAGLETPKGEGYWWGGSLVGVNDRPIVLTNPEKLVYSPHEYGPTVFEQEWFKVSEFPDNMPGIWDKQFGFIANKGEGHLFIGELGIKGEGGKDEVWFDKFLNYMDESKEAYSWTFWAWNPNSGDTGGILEYDWETVVQWKVDYLKPYMAPLIGNGNGVD